MNSSVHLVLGGTSGLGREIGRRLGQDEDEVWVLGSSYSDAGGLGMRVDLSNASSVDTTVDELAARLQGKLLKSFWWVSGYGYKGDFSGQDDPRRMATVNFGGALPIVQYAWQVMLQQSESSNFNIISSTTGQKPRNDEAVYSGTKFAQVGFGRSLGLEAERLSSPVNVALFLPGGMRTPFWDDTTPDDYNTYNDPAKVASVMIDAVSQQTGTFLEMAIERGTQL